jgi:hypothetical protein
MIGRSYTQYREMITPILSSDKQLSKRGGNGDMLTFIKDTRTESRIADWGAIGREIDIKMGIVPPDREPLPELPVRSENFGGRTKRTPEAFYQLALEARRRHLTSMRELANVKTVRRSTGVWSYIEINYYGDRLMWPGSYHAHEIPMQREAFERILRSVNRTVKDERKALGAN